MTQYVFGAGTIVARRTDSTPQRPALLGVTQEVTVDFTQELKELVGQNKFAVDVAPAQLKVTGKVKYARFQAFTVSDLMLGGSTSLSTSSGIDLVVAENYTSIASATFTTNAGAAFSEDFGVFYHSSGIALTPVTATPGTGQYLMSTATPGTYSISAADQSVAGGIDLYYTKTVTNLIQTSIQNSLMGTGGVFELFANEQYTVGGVQKKLNIKLNQCRASKFAQTFKNVDYSIPEMDFTAFADSSGNVGSLSTTE
jgi:hypothetical protein